MYIKGFVNTKDQSNACMWEMMSKGSKEALTVLIVTHVTQVERVESGGLRLLHNTAYRVPQFVTHVERVESILCIQ